MRIFDRVTERRRGKEGSRSANRSFHHSCDIFFVCLWENHTFYACVKANRQATGGEYVFFHPSFSGHPHHHTCHPGKKNLGKRTCMYVCMYVSHDLSVDKVQSNYGRANHRQSNWIENISGWASGFCVPCRVQLSEHHWSLRLKWHFPTQQAHARWGRESDWEISP